MIRSKISKIGAVFSEICPDRKIVGHGGDISRTIADSEFGPKAKCFGVRKLSHMREMKVAS